MERGRAVTDQRETLDVVTLLSSSRGIPPEDGLTSVAAPRSWVSAVIATSIRNPGRRESCKRERARLPCSDPPVRR